MLKTITGTTRIAVDSFVEDVVNYISIRGPERFKWLYDAAENILWVQVYAAWGWWIGERSRQPQRGLMEYKSVVIQLEERQNKYVVETKVIPISGEMRKCTGIHLGHAFKCALEVPDRLSLHEEIGDIGEDYV